MKIENLCPFGRMTIGAFLGALSGILAGLVLSLLIAFISQQFPGPHDDGPSTYSIASFLGMGAGAIVGSIFGAINFNRPK